MKRLFLSAAFILFNYFCASAESGLTGTEELSKIKGLSFECSNCLQVDENECQFERLGTIQRVSCDLLIERLLIAAAVRERREYPTTAELVEFLAFNQRNETLARNVIRLLLSDEPGRTAISKSFVRFHQSYGELLEYEMRNAALDESYLKEIWSQHELLAADTRAFIVSKSPTLTSVDFFSTLSVVDIDYDITQLKTALSVQSQLSYSFITELGEAIRFLFACKYSTDCPLGEAPTEVVREYEERVQATRVLAMIDESSSRDTVLDLLSKVNYQNIRTPRMHELVYRVVVESSPSPFQLSALPEQQQELVTHFAEHDPELRKVAFSENISLTSEASIVSSIDFLVLVAFMLVVVLVGLFQVRRWRLRQDELGELLRYFGLNQSSTLDELNQRFRQKARALHPDTSSGDPRQFAIMNECYQKAKVLMRSD